MTNHFVDPALNAARVETQIPCTSKEGTKKQVRFKCAKCGGLFPRKEVQVDHIVPVVGEEGFTTWDDFIKRLFCDVANLQVICDSCHCQKSAAERKARAEYKKRGSDET